MKKASLAAGKYENASFRCWIYENAARCPNGRRHIQDRIIGEIDKMLCDLPQIIVEIR